MFTAEEVEKLEKVIKHTEEVFDLMTELLKDKRELDNIQFRRRLETIMEIDDGT